MLRNLLSWRWWNERVIEIPEHYFDWMAPRWYPVLVCLIVAAVAALVIWSMGQP